LAGGRSFAVIVFREREIRVRTWHFCCGEGALSAAKKIFRIGFSFSCSLALKGVHDGLSLGRRRRCSFFPASELFSSQSKRPKGAAFQDPQRSRNALTDALTSDLRARVLLDGRKSQPEHGTRSLQHQKSTIGLFALLARFLTCNLSLPLLLLLLLSARTSTLGSARETGLPAGRLKASSGRAALPTPRRRIPRRNPEKKKTPFGNSFFLLSSPRGLFCWLASARPLAF